MGFRGFLPTITTQTLGASTKTAKPTMTSEILIRASLRSLTFAGTRSVLRTNESVIGRSIALAISCANDLHDNKRLACDTIQYNSQFKQVLKPQTLAIGTEYRVDTYCRRIASDWREKSMTRNDTTRKSTLL